MLTLRRKDELASICRPSQRPWLQQRRPGRPEDDDNEHDDNVDNNCDDNNADNVSRESQTIRRSHSIEIVKNAVATTRVASADDGDGDDGGDNDDENHRDDDDDDDDDGDDDDGDDDGDDDYVTDVINKNISGSTANGEDGRSLRVPGNPVGGASKRTNVTIGS
ncbi:hypothetical protein HZH66_012172 [Vespula vulgaris]|uniref:Uncharacterized protein n=1 Tax=Vespula vulgaris TaxID=7454 RepID=A0A834JAT1_VESVU|nr:hypothetical protein HZH66_012172 [Vespula vulgaris]